MQPTVRIPSARDARVAGALWFAWLRLLSPVTAALWLVIRGIPPANKLRMEAA